jgi:branched-chain amino acid transport system substrate-binding protein
MSPLARTAAIVFALGALLGCSGSEEKQTIPVGLLLSFSGDLAADSINSERALMMAFEAANAAGGIGGRPVELIARDSRSDSSRVARLAQELVDAGVVALVGPDTVDLAVAARTTLLDHTVVLPSFAAANVGAKPSSWFLLGAPISRIACELQALLRADGRRAPLLIMDARDYASLIGWWLTNTYGIPKFVIPNDGSPSEATLRMITSTSADAYVLAASPPSATSLVYALSAIGGLTDPGRWYLSPTLHTPAFLETIPAAVLAGSHGVAQGTAAGGGDFNAAFLAEWHDVPLDNAYAFFDAGAVVALALQHALTHEGVIPSGTGLVKHVLAVTRAAGTPVRWNELARGLALLREGKDVGYVGLTGPVEFDITGQTPTSLTKWWTIGPDGFADVPSKSECR